MPSPWPVLGVKGAVFRTVSHDSGYLLPPSAAFAARMAPVLSKQPCERLFQVEGHGVEKKLQFDLGLSEVLRAVKSIAALAVGFDMPVELHSEQIICGSQIIFRIQEVSHTKGHQAWRCAGQLR